MIFSRLPQKMTQKQFCKRITLLVFHFIVRDGGKEPKFWQTKSTEHRKSIEENSKAAFLEHMSPQEHYFYTLQFGVEVGKLKEGQPDLQIAQCFDKASEKVASANNS